MCTLVTYCEIGLNSVIAHKNHSYKYMIQCRQWLDKTWPQFVHTLSKTRTCFATLWLFLLNYLYNILDCRNQTGSKALKTHFGPGALASSKKLTRWLYLWSIREAILMRRLTRPALRLAGLRKGQARLESRMH